MRLMHHRKAASVFPVPVGARISVDSPRAIAGHPAICGRVGAGKTAVNQSHTAGWKSCRASADGSAGAGLRSLRTVQGGKSFLAVLI